MPYFGSSNKHVQIVQIHFFFVPADNFDAFYMNVH